MRIHIFIICAVTLLGMGSLLLMRAAEARSERVIYIASSEREEQTLSSRAASAPPSSAPKASAPVESTQTATATTSTVAAADEETVEEKEETSPAADDNAGRLEAEDTKKEEENVKKQEAESSDPVKEELATESASPEPHVETVPSDLAPESVSETEPEPVSDPGPIPEPEKSVAAANDEIDEAQENVDLSYPEAVARALHRLTNELRREEGLPVLSYDGALASIARGHSEDMIEQDYFAHEDPEGCDMTCRFAAAGYGAQTWGENIAWRSFTDIPDPAVAAERFLDAWMTSRDHRQNLLSEDFTLEGIGVVQVANKLYITVNFAAPW